MLREGAILRDFLADDGVSGPYGYPVTRVRVTGHRDGTVTGFEGGRIWWSAPAGAVALHKGAILSKYRRMQRSQRLARFPGAGALQVSRRSARQVRARLHHVGLQQEEAGGDTPMTSHPLVRPRTAILVSGLAAGALVFSLPPAPVAAEDQTHFVPAAKTWKLKGHGYGHGHGMGQYGAQGAALQGKTHRQILKFYYPGTSRSKIHVRLVRVLISADRTSDVLIRPAAGLRVRALTAGATWTLPKRASISRWRLVPTANGSTAVDYLDGRGWHRWRSPDGRETLAGNVQFRADGPLTLLVPSGSDVVAKRYRGALRSAVPYPGARTRDTVNVLRMDGYVKGVVPYEMPTSWHPQALAAQAVAARTYAAWQRSQSRHRYYQICDTTACQVYGGVAAEVRSSNAAVDATARSILTYGGKPAFTQFSASSGGWTSAGSAPYLPAKRDPYDDFAGNSMHTWHARVNPASLQRLHPNIGRLVRVRVTDREGHGEWGGRVQQIVLHGTRGRAYMTGDDFRWHFGLRSSWFRIAGPPS